MTPTQTPAHLASTSTPRPLSAQRRKLLRLLKHAEGMVEHYQEWLDGASAAVRDEDEDDLEAAMEQLQYLLLELSVDTRNMLYTARGLDG